MPTLDRRLLSWSDSDTEHDDDQRHTPTSSSWRRSHAHAADYDGSYDRCSAPAFVDDVLVPPEERAADDGRGVTEADRRRVSGTRSKACAAAGFVVAAIVGSLCAYMAWRCRTTS